MAIAVSSVADSCRAAKRAARVLARTDTAVKDAALEAIAAALELRVEEILAANERDMEAGRDAEIGDALLDRLGLDEARVAAIARAVRQIAALADPVGEVIDGQRLPNGLDVRKVRVPLGVVAVVYEARPNVTVDAAALCLKSGNAIVLRGSSAAARSNAWMSSIRSGASRIVAGASSCCSAKEIAAAALASTRGTGSADGIEGWACDPGDPRDGGDGGRLSWRPSVPRSTPPSTRPSNLPSRRAMNIALCCCFIISRTMSAIRSLPMYSA